jgi:hypothetical protein
MGHVSRYLVLYPSGSADGFYWVCIGLAFVRESEERPRGWVWENIGGFGNAFGSWLIFEGPASETTFGSARKTQFQRVPNLQMRVCC